MSEKLDSALGQDVDADITDLLMQWNAGDQEAVATLVSELTQDLKRLAASQLKGERKGHTLQPTALVNELYMRLQERRDVAWKDRGHFFAFAARTLRRILIDYARHHRAEKRGGDEQPITLKDHAALISQRDIGVLDLERALEQLAKEDERLVRVVELRFYGGLTIEETADVLGLAPATIKRDLKAARAFLLHRLKHNA